MLVHGLSFISCLIEVFITVSFYSHKCRLTEILIFTRDLAIHQFYAYLCSRSTEAISTRGPCMSEVMQVPRVLTQWWGFPVFHFAHHFDRLSMSAFVSLFCYVPAEVCAILPILFHVSSLNRLHKDKGLITINPETRNQLRTQVWAKIY